MHRSDDLSSALYNFNRDISAGWWFGTLFFCSINIGNVIIPTDELIFFGGVGIPPTSLVD